MSAGFTTGAILGGLLTDLLSWRWAFSINVPVALAVLVIAPTVIKESRPDERPKLDVPGAVSVTLGLLAIVLGLTQAGEHGWGSPSALLPLAAGMLLLVVFLAVERKVAAPLVPLSVLGKRSVAWGNVAGLIAFLTEASLVFLLTLYLQEVLGFSPLAAGLSFGVLGLGTVVGGSVAPKVIGKIGTKQTLITGGILQTLFTAALLGLGDDRSWMWLLLVATFVAGVGNMLVIVGFMVTATSGLADHEQGLATGLATMTQQIGITMGTPIMSAIATAAMTGTGASATLGGLKAAIAVNAAIVLRRPHQCPLPARCTVECAVTHRGTSHAAARSRRRPVKRQRSELRAWSSEGESVPVQACHHRLRVMAGVSQERIARNAPGRPGCWACGSSRAANPLSRVTVTGATPCATDAARAAGVRTRRVRRRSRARRTRSAARSASIETTGAPASAENQANSLEGRPPNSARRCDPVRISPGWTVVAS